MQTPAEGNTARVYTATAPTALFPTVLAISIFTQFVFIIDFLFTILNHFVSNGEFLFTHMQLLQLQHARNPLRLFL